MIFAETHVRFASPGFYEEDVRVDVRPTELRRSSVKLAFQMVCEADDRLLAEGWGTLVGYDYGQNRAAPLPDEIASADARRGRDGTGMEVERKFLLAEPPAGLAEHPSKRLEQGYLAIDPAGSEVRIRRKDDETLMTVKTGIGMVRGEEEFAIDRERFERLWPLTDGRQVVKTRYLVPLENGLTAEVDVYEGDLDGLVTGEVEFPDEADRARVRGAGMARARRHRRPALREPHARGRGPSLNAGCRGCVSPGGGLPQPKEPVHAPRNPRRHPGRRSRRHLVRIRSRRRARHGQDPVRLARHVPGRAERPHAVPVHERHDHQEHLLRRLRAGVAAAADHGQAEGRRQRRAPRCSGPRSAGTASGR